MWWTYAAVTWAGVYVPAAWSVCSLEATCPIEGSHLATYSPLKYGDLRVEAERGVAVNVCITSDGLYREPVAIRAVDRRGRETTSAPVRIPPTSAVCTEHWLPGVRAAKIVAIDPVYVGEPDPPDRPVGPPLEGTYELGVPLQLEDFTVTVLSLREAVPADLAAFPDGLAPPPELVAAAERLGFDGPPPPAPAWEARVQWDGCDETAEIVGLMSPPLCGVRVTISGLESEELVLHPLGP